MSAAAAPVAPADAAAAKEFSGAQLDPQLVKLNTKFKGQADKIAKLKQENDALKQKLAQASARHSRPPRVPKKGAAAAAAAAAAEAEPVA